MVGGRGGPTGTRNALMWAQAREAIAEFGEREFTAHEVAEVCSARRKNAPDTKQVNSFLQILRRRGEVTSRSRRPMLWRTTGLFSGPDWGEHRMNQRQDDKA